MGFAVDDETVRVRDALEQADLRLELDRAPDLQPALPELFPFPVDEAVSFEAGSLSVPAYSSVSVRDGDGDFIAQLNEPMEHPRGSYCVDISGTTKVLVRVDDVELTTTGAVESGPIDIEFDRPATVSVGARSLHTRPEATITVPDDPAALADAVSVLGSSIKEFSPERSWPTLRGYPPRIVRGEALEIPSPLVRPDTGVEVVARPDYADVYRLSTLSYYLGARMVVGDAPAIRLDTGFVETLPTEGEALETRAEALLRTCFFLDTLARTDGYVPSDRYEYEQVGPKLPFYPPNLADLSVSDRLMEYLEVDPATAAPYAPDWPTEAVLRPSPAGAEFLPHLAHVLAPVRVRGSPEPVDPDAPTALATSPWLAPADVVPNPDADPLPAGTSVLTPASYENRLRREMTGRGDVRVVALIDSAERATAIRHALSDPAAPEGIGEWEVIERPSANVTETALSDSSVDVAYCDLPVKKGEVVTADGAVALADLGGAPALTVFEGVEGIREGVAVVENGGFGAIVAAASLDAARVRNLIGLLAAGCPLAATVQSSTRERYEACRIIGDPATQIASVSGLPLSPLSVEAEGENGFRTVRSSVLTMSARIGTELLVVSEKYADLTELAGLCEREESWLTTAELFDLFTEPDGLLTVNGEVILPSPELTETELASRVRAIFADATPESFGREQSQRR